MIAQQSPLCGKHRNIAFTLCLLKSDLVWQSFLDFAPLTDFFLCSIISKDLVCILGSVRDPDPRGLSVFEPPRTRILLSTSNFVSTLIEKKLNFPRVQYKEIQMGSVAKSYMRKGLQYVRKCANI
jgi:hypothetical protein